MIPLRRNIAEMAGYVPGFQPPDTEAWIKLNTNENPYPPSHQVREAILAELGNDGESLRKYPDPGSRRARETAARLYGVDPAWVIMANGSDELLNNLIRAFAGEGEEVAYVHPSYSYYGTLAEIQGARIRTPGRTEMTGAYTRHSFDYVVPASEQGAGTAIFMRLMSEDVMAMSKGAVSAEPEIWRRCKPIS